MFGKFLLGGSKINTKKDILIVYDSRTGNVSRFVDKLKKRVAWSFLKANPDIKLGKPYHLLTYTTGIGEVPESTKSFLENNSDVLTVSSSGNLNWGLYFGQAADLISESYGAKILYKFELSGTTADIEEFIERTEQYYEA